MSQRFTGQNFDPHQAGQELRVTDVVTGHFLRRADRVDVTMEAIDVAKDEVTWRGSVDVDSKDMLTLRKEITTLLQKGLLPSLGVSNVELSITKPKSQESYELYLRSQDSVYWSVERNKDAIALLEKSVTLDPGYAPAWLALGQHYSVEADFGMGGEPMQKKAIASLERASQLDPGLLLPWTELIEREAFYGDISMSFARVQQVARRWPRRAKFTSHFLRPSARLAPLRKPRVNAKPHTNSMPNSQPVLAMCSTSIWDTWPKHVRKLNGHRESSAP